jgi:3-phenylpropionate/trans-cinnamate dioxygenase ferredoxin subunit
VTAGARGDASADPAAALAADGWTRAARLDELSAERPLGVRVRGRSLCLVLADGAPAALDDRCAHAEFPLSEGDVADGVVRCAWHGARFDARTGACVSPPLGGEACGAVGTYAARVSGGAVWVRV